MIRGSLNFKMTHVSHILLGDNSYLSLATALTVSHNCDMILFNFYHNWLIHNDLVSDFEGSNPSLTAK